MKTYNQIKQEIIDTSFKITKAIAKGNIGKAEKLTDKLNELIARAASKKPVDNNIKEYFGVVDDSFIRRNK